MVRSYEGVMRMDEQKRECSEVDEELEQLQAYVDRYGTAGMTVIIVDENRKPPSTLRDTEA